MAVRLDSLGAWVRRTDQRVEGSLSFPHHQLTTTLLDQKAWTPDQKEILEHLGRESNGQLFLSDGTLFYDIS